MKKIFVTLLCLALFNNTAKAQDDTAVAALGAALAIGGAIAAVEMAKEVAEQTAMEYVLNQRSDLTHFELKTESFVGVKGKDLSSVDFLTFTIKDMLKLDENRKHKRYILFGFNQSGFSNSNGIDFNKIDWKMFTAEEWNTMMSAYIELASDEKLTPTEIAAVKIVNKGVKRGGKFIIDFKKQKGDEYRVLDYSDEFKLVFNERSLGLFLKNNQEGDEEFYKANKSSLVQVRRKVIIKTHEFLNGQ